MIAKSLLGDLEKKKTQTDKLTNKLTDEPRHRARSKKFTAMGVFGRVESRNLCTLPSKVVFNQRLSSIKGRLPSKVGFHKRVSSIKDHPPSEVVFQERSSSINGCPLSKVVPQDHFPSKVVFHLRPSYIKGHLPSYSYLSFYKSGISLISSIQYFPNAKLNPIPHALLP